MASVVLEGVSKKFPGEKGKDIWAVKDLNLTVEAGELLAVVGPSGCGKSTTLRIIAGLEDPTEGTVRLSDQVVNHVPARGRDIAMVFQNHPLYPHMSVFGNMSLGLKLRKVRKPEIDQRVRDAAQILGLSACLDRKPKDLSGGERQRVAVGRAMVRNPKVFLFDEPLSNLDLPLRAQLRREIVQLHSRLGATMLYVTHDQFEAMAMGDRIAVMREGVLQQVGEPMTIYNAPVNMFVAGFFGVPPMNFLHGTILQREGGLLFQEEGSENGKGGELVRIDPVQAAGLGGHLGKPITLGIRPEDLTLAPRAAQLEAPPDGENLLAARLENVEILGAEKHLYLKTRVHSVIARVSVGEAVESTGLVWLGFDMKKARFFDAETQKSVEGTPPHQ